MSDIALFYDPTYQVTVEENDTVTTSLVNTNYLKSSQPLADANWTQTTSGGSLTETQNTSDTTAPDATNTACKLVFSAVSGGGAYAVARQSLSVAAGTYTLSIWLKGTGSGTLYFYAYDGTYRRLTCNYTTTWTRFILTFTATGTITIVDLGVNLNDGVQSAQGAQTVYSWHYQLEPQSSVHDYIPTTSAAVTTTQYITTTTTVDKQELIAALGTADFQVSANDLEVDDGLETAVMLSLFTDRAADSGDVLPDLSPDKRGWWGDSVPVVDGDKFGSKLWLLRRAKNTPEVLSRAADYARQALQWLIADKVADSLDVESEIVANGVLGIGITIYKPKSDPVSYRYNYTWAAQEARRG